MPTRKMINATYVSLDGAVENPHLWPSNGLPSDPREGEMKDELLRTCDAALMGRRTYDSFAAVWPGREGEFADRINAMPKYVVSSTLRDPEWENTHVISGDVAAEVAELKQAPGKNIVQYGIGPVTRTLIEAGLLDELQLWVFPQFVGSGKPEEFLVNVAPPAALKLTGSTPLTNGIMVLDYELSPA